MTASIVPPEDEHLINGWEPELPAEDSLVRQAVHAHASWPTEVARGSGRPWRSQHRWSGGWIGDRGALTNPVILTQPLTDPSGVIAEIESLFPSTVPYLMVSAWPTPDLREHGLVLLGHPPLMVRFPADRPPSPQPAIDVVEVQDSKELAVAERLLVEAFPMPDLEPLTPGDLLGPALLGRSIRIWIALLDGSPAAVAAAHPRSGVTLVEYVAALPSARGRGAGAAVTWAATLVEPDQPAVLISSDDGRPVYERMGYIAVERWTVWLRPGASRVTSS